MSRIVWLCLAWLLAVCAPAEAEEFECVIDPAVVVRVGGTVPGLLEAVVISRGDTVSKGQEIARLSSDVEQATVDLLSEQAASNAEIEAQLARELLAKSKLDRTRELEKRKVATTQQLEEAEAEFEVVTGELALARMRNRIAQLELERAKRVVDQRIIRSPIDGIVVERSLYAGEYLDQDGKVATVAQLHPLHVEAYLPVSYFGKIEVGSTAKIRPAEPIRGTFVGTVTVIDQVFDAASSTFGVRVELPNPDYRLPGGTRCRVSFSIATQ